jgi:hypothetical protein
MTIRPSTATTIIAATLYCALYPVDLTNGDATIENVPSVHVALASTISPSTDVVQPETDQALRDSVISRLGNDANEQEEDADDAMVPVRWEAGVGFVRQG